MVCYAHRPAGKFLNFLSVPLPGRLVSVFVWVVQDGTEKKKGTYFLCASAHITGQLEKRNKRNYWPVISVLAQRTVQSFTVLFLFSPPHSRFFMISCMRECGEKEKENSD